MRTILILIMTLFTTACSSAKLDVEPVQEFNLDAYLGTWYEIARLDHRFERGMTHVSANYTMRDDGGVRVLNKGLEDGEWEDAEGKAYLNGEPGEGKLKVTFFWPFYGDYIIFTLEENQYAFVSGGNDKYLWLLAREPEVSEEVRQRFIEESEALGYNLDELIWVEQDPTRE